MHKIFCQFLLLTLLVLSVAQAQSRLKTAETAQVEAGYIKDTVVLADDKGELFLEFLKGDRVAKILDSQIYDGEILPPVPIDAPARAPRARMREVLSFEVLSDTNEPLELIDQYAAIHAKKRLRLSLASTNDQRRQGAQLITTFKTDTNLGNPALWRYRPDNTREPWQRLGGILGDTSEPELQVFSAFLYATGTYTIWDENPNPEFEVAFPIDEIQLAEASPYPSVTEEEIGFDESNFVEELLGEEALTEEELSPEVAEVNALLDDLTPQPLIPAVADPSASNDLIVGPVVTSQPPSTAFDVTPNATADPLNPTAGGNPLSNLQALPNTTSGSSPLGALLELPGETPTTDETSLGQSLQANSFQDFGVNEGDLPEAGGFRFPWAILFVLGVIGFSVYAIRQKPY